MNSPEDIPRKSWSESAASWRHLDLILVLAVGALLFIGWLTMRGGAEGNADLLAVAKKQLLWISIGTGAFILMQLADYQRWMRFVPALYVVNILLLILLLLVGSQIKGARSWFHFGPMSFQPSETMKILCALAGAQWLALRPEGARTLRDLIAPAAICGVPSALILLQPDFGTAVVFIAIFAALVFWAGAPWKLLGQLALAGIIAAGAAYPVLKPYQKQRVRVFLGIERDAQGAAYNITQARIAIGSGGLTGKGWKQGTQTRLRFLPEHQTDFIFSSAVEQFGAVGALGIIGLFTILGWRCLRLVELARDRLGSFIVAGLAAISGAHVVLNIGMNLGLLPVTGLPLPLMSYGGTFMLSTMLLVGLVVNVGARRFLFATG